MIKTEMYIENGKLLVIWQCANEDLIGEVFNNGIEKRGKWDKRIRFSYKRNEATINRVLEYFGFKNDKAWWKRWG